MIQFVANGLAMYGWVAIVAVSFALIFRVVGFFHFAHGLVIMIGPYLHFCLLSHGVPLPLSLIVALICSGMVGVAIHVLIYRVVARHTVSPLALLLASLGVYLIGQNIISLLFGDDPITPSRFLFEGGLTVLGGRITGINCICLLLSVIIALFYGPILNATRLGKSMCAVASDRRLSMELGIGIERVMILTYFLGSTAAGLGGIMIAYDTSARPTMGMDALLPGVIAVVMGGTSGIAGVLCASLLLAMATHLGVIYVSSLWQQSIVFVILLLILVVRVYTNHPQIVPPEGNS